jgi:hypothetical protein
MEKARDAVRDFSSRQPRGNDGFGVEGTVMRHAAIRAEVTGEATQSAQHLVDMMERGRIPAPYHRRIFDALPSGAAGFAVLRDVAVTPSPLPQLERTQGDATLPRNVTPNPATILDATLSSSMTRPAYGHGSMPPLRHAATPNPYFIEDTLAWRQRHDDHRKHFAKIVGATATGSPASRYEPLSPMQRARLEAVAELDPRYDWVDRLGEDDGGSVSDATPVWNELTTSAPLDSESTRLPPMVYRSSGPKLLSPESTAAKATRKPATRANAAAKPAALSTRQLQLAKPREAPTPAHQHATAYELYAEARKAERRAAAKLAADCRTVHLPVAGIFASCGDPSAPFPTGIIM